MKWRQGIDNRKIYRHEKQFTSIRNFRALSYPVSFCM